MNYKIAKAFKKQTAKSYRLVAVKDSARIFLEPE